MEKLCSFPGCHRKRTRKDVCIQHRRQQLRGEDMRPIRRVYRNDGPCAFEGCTRPSAARGLCTAHYAQHRKGRELYPVGDQAAANRLRREAWARLSEDEKRERLAPMRSAPYERTEEWSRRVSAIRRAQWAEGKGHPSVERPCLGCGQSFMPASGRQTWCSNDCRRAHRRALSHKITLDELRAIESKQGSSCAICGRTAHLVIDHCHQTGRVRGLLCNRCNTGLGKFGEDPAMLLRAIHYLDATP